MQRFSPRFMSQQFSLCTSQSKPRPATPPPPPTQGTCGALVGLYWQLFESPVCGGFARFFCFCPEEYGALVHTGFVLIQDGDDHSHKDFWEYFSTWEWTQMFTGICGIRRIVMQINTSINLGHGFNIEMPLIFLFRCSVKITSLTVLILMECYD